MNKLFKYKHALNKCARRVNLYGSILFFSIDTQFLSNHNASVSYTYSCNQSDK